MTTATASEADQSCQTFRVYDGSVPDQIERRFVRLTKYYLNVPEGFPERVGAGEQLCWQCAEQDLSAIRACGPMAKIKTDSGDLYVDYSKDHEGSFWAYLSSSAPTHDRVGNPINKV